jgi:hypothetical protein
MAPPYTSSKVKSISWDRKNLCQFRNYIVLCADLRISIKVYGWGDGRGTGGDFNARTGEQQTGSPQRKKATLRRVVKIKGKSPTNSPVRYLFHGVFFTSYKTIICKQFFGNKFTQIGPAIIHGMCIAHNGNHDKCSISWLIFDVAFKYFIAVLLLPCCPSITVFM